MSGISGYSQKPLATFKTEKEAINFADKNKGCEVIVKDNNGYFSVHTITDDLALKIQDNKVNLKQITPNAFKFSISDDAKNSYAKNVFRAKAGGTTDVFDPKQTVKDCFDIVTNYPALKIPGFTTDKLPSGINTDFDSLSFYNVIGASGAPEINGEGGKYEKMVGAKLPDGTSYISRLQKNILNSGKENLTPADVLKFALDATKGDYGLASLAANNLLKNLTYRGRFEGAQSLSKDELAIVSKLGNLRESNSGDKMGPWYHFFGIQAAYAITERPNVARSLVDWEHTIRSEEAQEIRHAVGASLEMAGIGEKPALSPVDKEKGEIDYASCDLADNLFSKYAGVMDKVDNVAARIDLGALNIIGASVNWTVGKATQGYRLILEQAGVINPQK
ncbi:MAG: hypothetical protein U0354_07055 [Candidatus Sericytochromatia bacterium]